MDGRFTKKEEKAKQEEPSKEEPKQEKAPDTEKPTVEERRSWTSSKGKQWKGTSKNKQMV